MFSLLFPCIGKSKITGIMQAVSRAMECYFQRHKLGATNSGGCLSCSRKHKQTPTLHDWSDNMCMTITLFTTHKCGSFLSNLTCCAQMTSPRFTGSMVPPRTQLALERTFHSAMEYGLKCATTHLTLRSVVESPRGTIIGLHCDPFPVTFLNTT
jgi:hypothetical protein